MGLYPTDYHIINVSGDVKLDDAVVNFDDFQPSATAIVYMDKLKEMYPDFKVTMFAIPGRLLQNSEWLNDWESRKSWIQLAVHGWSHADNYECTRWNKADTVWLLDAAEHHFPEWVHGFKAPGWQIGDECYKGLLEKGYWVADQAYNDERRPKELRAYTTSHPWIVHGHTWDMGYHPFNGVGQMTKENRFPFKVDTRFHFIDDIVKNNITGREEVPTDDNVRSPDNQGEAHIEMPSNDAPVQRPEGVPSDSNRPDKGQPFKPDWWIN